MPGAERVMATEPMPSARQYTEGGPSARRVTEDDSVARLARH